MKKKLKRKLKLEKLLSSYNCYSAKNNLLKASVKRNKRKTLYPFGFEYAKEKR